MFERSNNTHVAVNLIPVASHRPQNIILLYGASTTWLKIDWDPVVDVQCSILSLCPGKESLLPQQRVEECLGNTVSFVPRFQTPP